MNQMVYEDHFWAVFKGCPVQEIWLYMLLYKTTIQDLSQPYTLSFCYQKELSPTHIPQPTVVASYTKI